MKFMVGRSCGEMPDLGLSEPISAVFTVSRDMPFLNGNGGL